jgi:hypothetical protein
MKNLDNVKTVATAVRLESESSSGKLYIVFEIVDEEFKKRINDNWKADIPLVLIGKDLKEI